MYNKQNIIFFVSSHCFLLFLSASVHFSYLFSASRYLFDAFCKSPPAISEDTWYTSFFYLFLNSRFVFFCELIPSSFFRGRTDVRIDVYYLISNKRKLTKTRQTLITCHFRPLWNCPINSAIAFIRGRNKTFRVFLFFQFKIISIPLCENPSSENRSFSPWILRFF